MTLYDTIGAGYVATRTADPRIVDAMLRLLRLPSGQVIADIGAGTGNYSRALADRGYPVLAIEPSAVMRSQALPHPEVSVIGGTAENIPLRRGSVAAALTILAFHHFADPAQALQEMARVAGSGPLLLFTFDPRVCDRPWMADYFPSIWDQAFDLFPSLAAVADLIARCTGRAVVTQPLPLPDDLQDLFFAAGWRRPESYLSATIRSNMSAFALADRAAIEMGVRRLRRDLETGDWQRQHGSLLTQEELDLGYRFLVTRAESRNGV